MAPYFCPLYYFEGISVVFTSYQSHSNVMVISWLSYGNPDVKTRKTGGLYVKDT